MKKFLPFGVLIFVVLLSLLFPSVDIVTVKNSHIDTGDTAWLLVSTALVLVMTPGLAFFYGGMVSKKKCFVYHDAEFCLHGHNYHHMGNIRLQPCLW